MDKSKWPPGPWHNEPDSLAWEHEGYTCYIRRTHSSGRFSAAITIPKNHNWYKVPYQEIIAKVHGGLNFGDLTIDGSWLIAFDTYLATDWRPVDFGSPTKSVTYKDWNYVKNEVESLVRQAKKYEFARPDEVFKNLLRG